MENLRRMQRRFSGGGQPKKRDDSPKTDNRASNKQYGDRGAQKIVESSKTTRSAAIIGAQGESQDVQDTCNLCHKIAQEIEGKINNVECFFCNKWACPTCVELPQNGDIEANEWITRPDIFWACKNCLGTVKSLGPRVSLEASEILITRSDQIMMSMTDFAGATIETMQNNEKMLEKLTTLESGLKSQIQENYTKLDNLEQKIQEKIPENIKSLIENSVEPLQNQINTNTNMVKTFAEVLMCDDEFPSVDTEQFRSAPVKPKTTLSKMITKALDDSDSKKRESLRKNNLVLYKVPEYTDKSPAVRARKENDFVDELLDAIKTEVRPIKVYRLGKLDEGATGSRPIKLEFEDHFCQSEVMYNAKNLKDAPDHLKNVSISYDLSKEERETVSEMVKDAKNKSKNSTEFVYKVRGPPGKMEIVEIKK